MNSIGAYLPAPIRPIIKRYFLILHVYIFKWFYYFGHRIYTPSGSVIFKRIAQSGPFEPDIVDVMVALARPNTLVWDVGANIGVMTAAVLARREDIKIVAFECSPSTLLYLRQTYEASPHKNRWSLMEVAIAGEDGTVDFFTSGACNGAYDGLSDTARGGPSSKVSVLAKRLDSAWEELGRPPVSLIKLDIEGGEWEAIKSANSLIGTCKPYIVFEWNPVNLRAYSIAVEDIFALVPPGYELLSLPTLRPLNKSVLSLEVMRTEMFLLAPKM